ncbi:glycosyltransferase family A protein [Pedobacter sandarakinus]|nr:glycosyltransferase family A protein [Pedobacter sandarakinus]
MENITYALLVPCYNAERYVDEFLNHLSLLSRHFDEVIFYDDGSTDNTYQILTERKQQVIKGLGNNGPGYARNQLLSKSSATFVHFHDIDDFMHVDYLKETSWLVESAPYDVVLCNVDWLNEDGELERSWNYSNHDLNADPISYAISHPIGGINGLYRKQTLIEISGYNTSSRIWEDADLHVRLAGANANFFVIEKTLCHSIRRTNTASNDQTMGWKIRLAYLQDYSKSCFNGEQQKVIGIEAQTVASRLIMLNEIPDAITALKLSEKCGIRVPNSTKILWRLLKTILSHNLIIRLRISQLMFSFNKKLYLHLGKI